MQRGHYGRRPNPEDFYGPPRPVLLGDYDEQYRREQELEFQRPVRYESPEIDREVVIERKMIQNEREQIELQKRELEDQKLRIEAQRRNAMDEKREFENRKKLLEVEKKRMEAVQKQMEVDKKKLESDRLLLIQQNKKETDLEAKERLLKESKQKENDKKWNEFEVKQTQASSSVKRTHEEAFKSTDKKVVGSSQTSTAVNNDISGIQKSYNKRSIGVQTPQKFILSALINSGPDLKHLIQNCVDSAADEMKREISKFLVDVRNNLLNK